jgi:FAD binding domain/Berberine and berberine like
MTTLIGTTLSGAHTRIDNRAIDDLATDLSRPPILPGSAEYEERRNVFNKMIDKRPALIVSCGGVADVLRAVRFAREHDLIVAVRGGAHNAAGFATCDGGIVIDLSPMRAVRVDVVKRLVRVEGGATWGDVDRETQAFGLVAVGGIVSTTGVAGLTLGGGQGWFRRSFGMTCDNLVSADVVTAGGRLLHVSATEHQDLLWALKGGGGNFGIVTSFEFRLHPLGPMVAFAGPVYTMDKARTILRRFADFAASAPDEVNLAAVLWSIPGGSAFPQHLHGREVLIISGTYAGAPERGHEVLRPLREFAEPVLDMSTTLPYCALQQLYDPFFRKGELLHYWKAIYLDRLTDDTIDAVVAGCAVRPSPRSLLAIHALGGAMGRVSNDETPIGNRSAPFLLEVIGSWSEAAHTEQNVVWVRHVFETMHSFSSGKINPNFSGAGEDNERFVRAAFGDQYQRLASVKHAYDPANVFRLNQNIAVAAG